MLDDSLLHYLLPLFSFQFIVLYIWASWFLRTNSGFQNSRNSEESFLLLLLPLNYTSLHRLNLLFQKGEKKKKKIYAFLSFGSKIKRLRMKAFGFVLMLLLIGTATLVYLGYSSKGTTIFHPGKLFVSFLEFFMDIDSRFLPNGAGNSRFCPCWNGHGEKLSYVTP